MQFLAISRMRTELFSESDFAPLLEDEAQRARTLYIEGAVRQIWHRGDERGACSLLKRIGKERRERSSAPYPSSKQVCWNS